MIKKTPTFSFILNVCAVRDWVKILICVIMPLTSMVILLSWLTTRKSIKPPKYLGCGIDHPLGALIFGLSILFLRLGVVHLSSRHDQFQERCSCYDVEITFAWIVIVVLEGHRICIVLENGFQTVLQLQQLANSQPLFFHVTLVVMTT